MRRLRATLACVAAMPCLAAAQAPGDPVRDAIAGARLGAGYAQMVNLSAAPEVTAALYDIENPGRAPAQLDVAHLPYRHPWFTPAPGTDLYWKASGGYLRLRDQYSPTGDGGSIASRWSAYSGNAGVIARVRLAEGLTLEPALSAGIARLDNHASYAGDAAALAPILDGGLFNWQTNAWLANAALGLDWEARAAGGRANLLASVARSWTGSFNESDPILGFRESANIYSLRAEYVRESEMRLFDRPVSWLANAGYVGFFGANREALGFSSFAEIGAGLEIPMPLGAGRSERLRLSAARMLGDGVKGWTVGIGIRY